MRMRLTYILLFLPLIGSCQLFWQGGGAPSGEQTYDATNWYIKNDGDDTKHGHTPDSAITTIAELETKNIQPGDSIFFKCGDTWRLTSDWDISWRGGSGNHIVITSYGSGDRPRILGSDTITSWTDHGSNRWGGDTEVSGHTESTSRIFFVYADSIAWGIWESDGLSDLDTLHEYYESNDTIYVCSPSGNPASVFVSVEIPTRSHIIELQTGGDSSEYLTIEKLEIAYGENDGINDEYPGGITGQTRSLRDIKIYDCKIHHFGVKDGDNDYAIHFWGRSNITVDGCEIYECGRRGLSIAPDGSYPSDSIYNVLVQNNTFYNGYHTTGPDIQLDGGVSVIMDSIVIRNNVIYEDTALSIVSGEESIAMFIQNDANNIGKVQNVWIYNNLFKNVRGDGLQVNTRDNASNIIDDLYIHNNVFYDFHPDLNVGSGLIRIDSASGTYTDTYVRNNITYSTVDEYNVRCEPLTGVFMDYNLNYKTVSGNMFRYDGTGYEQDELNDYKSVSGFESNSPIPSDPLFVDPPDDLRVYTGSHAIDSGVAITGYTTDYLGDTVSDPPNIGAYETPVSAYTTFSEWTNDTLNRFYTTGVPAFQTDIYFDEDGAITYGNEVASANAVINGDIYDYFWDDGTLYVNYDWIDTTGAVITPLAGDTIRPVDVHGQLNVSGRYLRNEDNDTIILRGVGVERQSDVWGYTRFANLSYVTYGRDAMGIQCYRVTLPVEVDKTSPYDDFYFNDSLNRIADMQTFAHHCISAGVYVIINWHEFVTGSSPGGSHLGSAIYYWQQMATEFDGIDNVIFEIYNEPRNFSPYDYSWSSDIKPYAEVLIDSIRAIDTDNSILILVGVDDYCADFSGVAASPIAGESNIMYTLHFYAYADDAAERGEHTNYIVDNDLPVWMTEGGGMNYDGDAPFDLDEWDDWYDWMDTMKISSNAWTLTDKNSFHNHMLLAPELIPSQVSANGFWSDSEKRQWGREVQYKLRGYDLPNHVSIYVPSGGAASSTVWDDLVAYYDFDSDATDAVGSADGTVYGATNVVGFENNCYTFNGNDSIGFGQAVVNSQDITFAAWVNITADNAQRTIIGWTDNGGPQFRISDDDYLQLLEQNTSIIGSTDPVTEGVWLHVAVTYNTAGNYAFYVNGDLEASGTNDKTLVFSSMTIGAQAAGESNEYFDGEIDEVGIWDVVKTANEISELYNSGDGKFYDP